MIALIICTLYLVLSGVFGVLSRQALESRCESGSHSYCDHGISAFFLGAAWPAGVFILLGIVGGDILASLPEWLAAKEQRAQAKHDRKMAALAAERQNKELSIKELELATAQLEQYGVKAGVPGLREAVLDV